MSKVRVTEDVEVILVDSTIIYVPALERTKLLDMIHRSHSKTLYWWHGLHEQVTKLVLSCDICSKAMRSKSQVEECERSDPSMSPMHRCCFNIFQWESQQYLVTVDKFLDTVVFKRLEPERILQSLEPEKMLLEGNVL